ncbi:MAG TPA: sigma factor-like helix-turn-helix DNA-binding protein [Candidatus Dormibacteraeota bacterium]
MALDSLTSRERQVALFERYGALLTEHQRTVLDLYLRRDWSLAEVAARQKTSRAAVHDLLRRSAQTLEDYERKLGLLDEDRRRREELDSLKRRLERLT